MQGRDKQEATMKYLTLTIAALSVAAVTSAAASVNPAAVGTTVATDTAAAKPGYTVQAQRYRAYRYYRKCQEDLGYGRTGSYGCG
jgi:hypothetical protein